MPNAPIYPNAKPISCDVLLLCEGDAVGYETNLIKRWLDSIDFSGKFVQVLTCGTADSLFGVADSVGRTVPIIVIEDRDFRTEQESASDCDRLRRNREARNVAMRGWLTWRRAEIENYFTDDSILAPVFSTVFKCSLDDVRSAVADVLRGLAVSQALEYSLYRVRRRWKSMDANRSLRVEAQEWNAIGRRFLEQKDVRSKLEGRLKKWQLNVHNESGWADPMDGKELLADFDRKCEEWTNLSYDSPDWRINWACKEVLKEVRMSLAARAGGWWSVDDARNPVDWRSMTPQQRDAHDRKLEREIQPELVRAAVRPQWDAHPAEVLAEFESLANLIRSA